MREKVAIVLSAVVLLLTSLHSAPAHAQTPTGTLRIEVRNGPDGGPVESATVTAGKISASTNAEGVAVIKVPAGRIEIGVSHDGYMTALTSVDVGPGAAQTVRIALTARPVVEEEVTVVASTRTGRRVEDQPMRVEVLGREEIEEKMLMTPGDIVMMLNEMGGLRVQATSPSLGAASVRIQGMRGRYTQFLSDGLPLFGEQPGGMGLLQIPPMDLGQVINYTRGGVRPRLFWDDKQGRSFFATAGITVEDRRGGTVTGGVEQG